MVKLTKPMYILLVENKKKAADIADAEAQSNVGHGSCFWVKIPVSKN
jgi:hypothetical protein